MLLFPVPNKFFVHFQLYFWQILHNEPVLLDFLTKFMITSALITFVTFTFLGLRASYGRYAPTSLLAKFAIPARIAWFLQELPSFVIPSFAVWQVRDRSLPLPNAIVLFMFIGHYFQRSFIYPYLIRGGKSTPIHLFLLGFIFCTWNGFIQGFYHAKYAHYYSRAHFWSFDSLIGLSLFLLGMIINLQSDHILRNLRVPGEKGYKIPRGGMFEFVSGANFFGEIVEWVGYALFAKTQTAWAFALFTAANTIPRAKEHHRWYLEKFDDYPRNRRAVIPFLY